MSAPQYVKEFNADLGELALNTGSGKLIEEIWLKILQPLENSGRKKKLFIKRTVDRVEIDINGETTPYIIERA